MAQAITYDVHAIKTAGEYGLIMSSNSTYTTMMNGSSLTDRTSYWTPHTISGVDVATGPVYYGYETFLKFDLSPLPYGAIIRDVDMKIYPASTQETGGTFLLEVYNYDFGTFGTADWQNSSELAALNSSGKRLAYADSSDLDAGALSFVNMTMTSYAKGLIQAAVDSGAGSFPVIMATNKMRLASVPTNDRYTRYYDATGAGEPGVEPRLVIGYDHPGAVGTLGVAM